MSGSACRTNFTVASSLRLLIPPARNVVLLALRASAIVLYRRPLLLFVANYGYAQEL